VSSVDWTGPYIDIVDELVSLRFDWYVTKNGGYITEGESDEAYEWADRYAAKYVDALDPKWEGLV
jgi:hypothetical protein